MSLDLPTGPSRPTDYDEVKAKEDAARLERNRQAAELLTVLEPKSYGNSAVSQAISLRRLADVLERFEAHERARWHGGGGGSPYIAGGGGGAGEPTTFTGGR